MENDFHPFTSVLLAWYSQNRRNLPWRSAKNPYSIWLSEIILQQTRVEQGIGYYYKFLDAFPSVDKLAAAPVDKIMLLWQGLGYYSRARNLHAAAKMVVNTYNGKFPDSYEELRKLPGVGPYTASAIASIGFNLPHAVVDGNVYRLLSRYFNIDTAIDSSFGAKAFFELANELIPHEHPGDFNQAMMDFGSLVCKPKNPSCAVCPLSAGCGAFRYSRVDFLPVKKGRIKVRKRYFIYLIVEDAEGNTLVKKRGPKDIWEGLYEFPLFELNDEKSWLDPLASEEIQSFFKSLQANVDKVSNPVKHILSHQHLHVAFIHATPRALNMKGSFEKVPISTLNQLGMPRVITRYLEKNT